MSDQEKLALAEKAIRHTLNAICSDPRKYWLLGKGTQSYALMTEAIAACSNTPLTVVQETFRPDKREYEGYQQQREDEQRWIEIGREQEAREGGGS